MSLELVTVVVLAVMFVVGTVRSVNMGVLGLVAAFWVGLVGVGMSTEEIFAGFPVDLLMALMGLTFLFGFAQRNGSIDLIVRWSLQAVRGRVALAPWIFFAVTGLLMGIGAIFAIACIAPLAIPFARRYRINQLMMGMMVVHGGMAGAFSPMSVYGVFVNGFLAQQDLPESPLGLFLASFVFNVLIGLLVYLTMGGRQLIGRRLRAEDVTRPGGAGDPATPGPAGPAGDERDRATATSGARGAVALRPAPVADPAPGQGGSLAAPLRPTGFQLLTLLGLAVMAVGTAGFGVDIGILSITIAGVLAVLRPEDAKVALAEVSWGTVVLVGGVVTYIEVLQAAGTVEFASSHIAGIGVPLLAVLLLCYLSGLVSALASSIGTIGVAVAIAAPMLTSGEVSAIGFVAALSISATVVDVSPFSTNGALVLANVDPASRERFFRQMLVYSGVIVAVAPALAWTAVLLPW